MKRCNRCHRPMRGTTAHDGACECGGLIEAAPVPKPKRILVVQVMPDGAEKVLHPEQ